jgi:hypothetical protein
MATTQLQIAYRPIRLGLLVRERSRIDLRAAICLATYLWGGRYDPILGVRPQSSDLDRSISRYRLDALHALRSTDASREVIERHNYLRWPWLGGDSESIIWEDSATPQAVDLVRAIRVLESQRGPPPTRQPVLATWEDADPHALVFAATFGDLSADDRIAARIRTAFVSATGAVEMPAAEVAAAFETYLSPLDVGVSGLEVLPPWGRFEDAEGVFVGSARSLRDIRAYWNIRCALRDVLFWDATSADGGPFAPAIAEQIMAAPSVEAEDVPWRRVFPCFAVTTSDPAHIQLPPRLQELIAPNFQPSISALRHDAGITDLWRTGLRDLPSTPELSVVAHSEEWGSDASRVVVPLPPTPLASRDFGTRQELVVSVRSYVDSGYRGTLKLPFLPDLNDWYRWEVLPSVGSLRVQEEGFGAIDNLLGPTVDLLPLDRRKLLAKLFERAGIKAERSLPGEAAWNLLSQLGGYGALRILRLPGVRALLSSSAARRGLRRNRAKEMIRGQGAVIEAEPLFVGGRRLSADDVWTLLLERRIFLPGLELKCPWCQHASFLPAGDLGDEIRCPKCGRTFLLAPAIVGDPLRFRLSGLLEDRPGGTSADSDSQPAAIPVLLALLYLSDWSFGAEGLVLEASHELSGDGVGACETDVVAISYGDRPRPHTHLLLGECKGRGRVDTGDVEKLLRASQAVGATSGVECDLLFATTREEFDQEEIELFRTCYEQSSEHEWLRRAPVLLTRRELESFRLASVGDDDRPDRIPGAWSGFAQLVAWSTRRYFAPPDAVHITPT